MATKKITLNELRSIVKQIIKEEESLYDSGFYDDIDDKTIYVDEDMTKKNHFSIENDYRVIKRGISFNDIKKYISNNNNIVFNGETAPLECVDSLDEYKEFKQLYNSLFYLENHEKRDLIKKYVKTVHPSIFDKWIKCE